MRFIIKALIFILIPSFLYSYDYYDYLREKNAIKNKEIILKHKRELAKLKEQKEREKIRERERRIRETKIANERYYRKLKYKNRYSENTQRSYVKKTYDPKDFKNKPQIKLGELHILGITSIKPFRNNKYIIKATNGTFALPKDKFEKAEKINFYPGLIK